MHTLKVRLRHLRELAEAIDDGLQIRYFCQQRDSALTKDLVKHGRILLTSTDQVLDRQLQREEGILEFVCEPPRQFTPCCNAFGLNETIFLLHKVARHLVESVRELTEFVGRIDVYLRTEVSCSHILRRSRKIFYWTRDSRSGPTAEDHSEENSQTSDQQSSRLNVLFQFDIISARVGDKQHT